MSSDNDPLESGLSGLKHSLVSVAAYSAAVNLLMLTGPLFMLQIYDRVLASRSVPTLVVLFALVACLYAYLAFFDFVRVRILSRAAHKFDLELMPVVQKTWIYQGLAGGRIASRPEQDLGMVRQFLGSTGPCAFFDLPWVPIYLAIVFLLHFWLGTLALAGTVVVVGLTIANELATRKPASESVPHELASSLMGQQLHSNAEAVVSMGMVGHLIKVWSKTRRTAIAYAQQAGGASEGLTAITKGFRMFMQSGVLALGALLVIQQQITSGTMIAASIIVGRALAPIDQTIGQWKGFSRARLAYGRLKSLIGGTRSQQQPMPLPAPKGRISVRNLVKMPVGLSGRPDIQAPAILQGLNFDLEPGDGLGVIGPSASGKSSLARLLVGLWSPDRGAVRLDGATFDLWEREALGRYIGYLPQDVALFTGSIRDNIARFDPDADHEQVIKAAELTGIHDMILEIPGGYDARIGENGVFLSGGQAQRVALARAVFCLPALVVLDEPNANLDAQGDEALSRCIAALRHAGSTVVVMAHRPSALAEVNKLLMIRAGQQIMFGNKEDVLKKVTRAVPNDPSGVQRPLGHDPHVSIPRAS